MRKIAAEKKYKNIIEEAHPEPVYVAEALGNGGLVENLNEQQAKAIEQINKFPTGSLVHRYAEISLELVKVAAYCKRCGLDNQANMILEAAEELLDE